MKYSVRLLVAALFIAGLSACTVQPVDPTADLPVLSYQTDISPIISANCASSGCHDGNGDLGNLQTYDNLMSFCDVQPGKPHSSNLYKIIRSYTGNVMPPKPNSQLTDEQIATIYVWILQGAKNN